MNKYVFLLLAALSITATSLSAQVNPTLDNYLLNPVRLSPAAAGTLDRDLELIYVKQWVGINGAPQSSMLSYDYMTEGRLGLNVEVVNDQVGPVASNSLGFATAYHLQVGRKQYVSMGLRGTFTQFNVNLMDVTVLDNWDPKFLQNYQTNWLPNVDWSLNYRSEKAYVGFAIKNLIENPLFENNYTVSTTSFWGGYRSKIKRTDWTLHPSAVVHFTENYPVDLNLHLMAEYGRMYSFGAVMSPGDHIGLIGKLMPNTKTTIIYRYTYPISALSQATFQSHMIGLGYSFNAPIKRIVSPRYFF
jgi:type IX secretion system PorP/SprF family membrane protein